MEETIYLQEITLGQLLDNTVSKYPDNEVVVYVDRDLRFTYREFLDLVNRLAKGLMGLGVKKKAKKSQYGLQMYLIGLHFNLPLPRLVQYSLQ